MHHDIIHISILKYLCIKIPYLLFHLGLIKSLDPICINS